VNYEPHYPFPPARAYALNRVLYLLKSDPDFVTRYVADAAAALAEFGLAEDERAALLSGERERIVAAGGHPYLVFMADLRVRGARGETTYEYF
jgi:hypothetical protein